jgi:hypothetical protein
MWRRRQNLLGDFICLMFEWIIELSDNKFWLYGAGRIRVRVNPHMTEVVAEPGLHSVTRLQIERLAGLGRNHDRARQAACFPLACTGRYRLHR